MIRTSCLGVVKILLVLLLIKDNDSQTTQNLNVLFVNEENNMVADKAVEVAVSYLSKGSKLGVTADIVKVVGNRTDAQGLLDSLCNKYIEMLDNKKPPHIVLDTTMAGMASETVKSFSLALAIPTISASFGQVGDLRQWRKIGQEEEYLVQVNPPADMIPELVRALVLNQNITNAAIMFDDSFVMDHKYKSLLQNVATRHVIAPISEVDIGEQLTKFRNLDIVNYFILGSLLNIKRVLDAADNRNYFGRTYAWHALTQDEGELRCSCRNATVMYAKPVIDPQYRERLGTIKTAHQLNAKPEIAAAFYFDLALSAFLTMKDLIADGAWRNVTDYITCDEYDGKNTPKRIGLNLREYFNKERTESPTYGPINMSDKNGESYMDFEMQITAVSVREGASDKSVYLGKWRSGYSANLTLDKPNDMKNYTADVVYRIATVVQKPFIIENPDAPKGYEGYCIDLIEKIREIVGFDYEIYAVPDGKFGNMDENGKWDGVVRDLIEKKADIGLGSMSVMAERENVIDFTVPYYDLVGITILMKLPKSPTSLFKFLTVLENQVWLCILAAYFFTSFLMWVFDRWSPYSYQNNREKYKDDEEKREFNLKECLWFCMTSLTPQGGGEAPKNLSGRLVAATWWLFGFIIIASYTANLAAFLTVSRLDTPIESLDDLSKQYKIQYAPLNGSATMTYFKRMADIEAKFYEIWKDMSLNDSLSEVERSKLAVWDYPVSDKYTKMWQSMQEAVPPNTLDEAVQRVRDSKSSSEGFAFLGDATDIRYLQLTNCDLQMVGEEFSRKPYAIAVQQGSPLKDQFNSAILTLLNKRELERLKETWWTKNKEAQKCEKADDQSDGISIQNIGGVFIVIFVGIGLACITLAFEYWWYKYRKGSRVIDVKEAPNKTTGEHPTKPTQGFNFKGSKLYPRSRF